MRLSPCAARAYLCASLIAAAAAPAFSQTLGLTVDMMAPSTQCTGSKCPSDISLPQMGGVISAVDASLTGTLGTVTLDTAAALPIVCSEQHGSTFGANGTYQFSPIFNNASPGGLFEFDAGGASVVDSSVSFGSTLAFTHANTTGNQVACYPINAIGVDAPVYADSSVSGDRVFYAQFEGGHRSDEPWVSVNTVASPNGSGHALGYVMQIHNASTAVSWHMSFGYDHAFFSAANNGGFNPNWCILSKPQPGVVDTTGALCADVTTTHVFSSGDIQAATNSIFVYVTNSASSSAVSNWAGLPTSFYAASAAVFAPPGTYAQRIDDKVAVASNVNIPTQNIGNIVCANDPLATACTITDPDGAGVPAAVTYKNQFSLGAVTVDPVAYVVDTGAGTTLPGSTTLGAPSNVSCNDPNGILAGNIGFSTSSGATGASALAFAFSPSGALYQPGTATCTATFTANGISSRQSFNITMQQVNVTHFTVTADSTATAGDTVSFTVTAKDGADHTVPTYNGTVRFTTSDGQGTVPANSALTLGVGNFSATLKTAGAQTITATDTSSSTIKGTSNSVAVSAASAATLSVEILSHAQVGVSTGLNVTPFDQYGNPVNTGYVGVVHFTSTDVGATLPIDLPYSNGVYNVTFNSPGTQTVTATDTVTSSITGTSNDVTVN